MQVSPDSNSPDGNSPDGNSSDGEQRPFSSNEKSSLTPSDREIPRRLVDLEHRLDALENETGPPGSAVRRLQRRIADLESREHHQAQALAHLEGRLAALQEHLIPAGGRSELTETGNQASPVPSFPSPPRRSLARRGLDVLHYLRYVWRRLKGEEDGPFPDHSLVETLGPEVHQLPRLGIVVHLTDEDEPEGVATHLRRQSEEDLPYFIYTASSGRLSRRPAGDDKPSGDTDDEPTIVASDGLTQHLRQWAPTEYLVATTVDQLARWPSTLCETVRLALAAEELDLLEILLSSSDRLMVQKTAYFRAKEPLTADRLRSEMPTAIAKLVNLASVPVASELDRCFERRFGPYRYGKNGRTLRRHPIVPIANNESTRRPATDNPVSDSTATNSTATNSTEARLPLLLASDLLAGREQLFSDLFLRSAVRRLALIGGTDPLSLERWTQLHRLRRLDGQESCIYPIAQFLPTALHSGAVTWLAQRWQLSALLPLSDDPSSESLAAACRSLGLPNIDPPKHRAGFVACGYDPGDGDRSAKAGGTAMRKQLGLDPNCPIVLWFGDVLASRRPEDFLALAQRYRETPSKAFFLMVGRGPAEGSIDDLARFFDLGNFRRLPSLPLSFAIALSDVFCLTSRVEPLPFGMLAALSEGRPVMLPRGSALASWMTSKEAASSYAAGDIDAAQEILQELFDPKQRKTLGERGQRLSQEHFRLANADRAWRQVLLTE